MARAYTNYVTRRGQQIGGPGMVLNDAGGYGFVLDPFERLTRFLILGSEKGTYYVGELKLTAENAEGVIECIRQNGERVVDMAYTVNMENRAPKVDPSLFVMALCLCPKYAPNVNTRRLAERRVHQMVRTQSHKALFVSMIHPMGWNRIKRRMARRWYNSRSPEWIAFQGIKFRNRYEFPVRDILRLVKPRPEDQAHSDVYRYLVGKEVELTKLPDIAQRYVELWHDLSVAPEGIIPRTLAAIENGLPREALPTEALADLEVLRALLPKMPATALLRNLARLASRTLLTEREAIDYVCGRLRDIEWLRKARVHPFGVMLAMLVYRMGHSPARPGARAMSEQRWTVQPDILTALGNGFEGLINAEPRDDIRALFAVDYSGSMAQAAMGTPVSCALASSAIALVLGRAQKGSEFALFTTRVHRKMPITERTTFEDLVHRGPPEGTDIASPIAHALANREWYNAIVIITDNETWAGPVHVHIQMEEYRRKLNPNCKLVICGMTSSHANVVNPNDPQALGIVGLDGNVAKLINDFVGTPQHALIAADGEDDDDA